MSDATTATEAAPSQHAKYTRNQPYISRVITNDRLTGPESEKETILIELDSLTMRQYIGLRFASNAELPELARRAVRENLSEKQIKAAVVSWRPDNNRI